MKLTIHSVQIDIPWEDKPATFAKVRALLSGTKLSTGDLVILPEMFATGFSKDLSKTAESFETGPTLAFLRELASSTQCAVMGGYVTLQANGLGQNEAVTVGPDGSVLSRYIKRQPFSLGGECTVHQAGRECVAFPYQGFRLSPLICYDLRFPELARDAISLGADVLVYIASWPIKRAQHWITLLQARAIENQCYVVGVNRTGTDPEFQYPGCTIVVDPHGVIVADAADREEVLSYPLDLSVVTDWRQQFPALNDARLPI